LVPGATGERAEVHAAFRFAVQIDGITEAVNRAEELFGPERLLRSVERHAGKPVDELQASILADVEEFSRGAHQADDITLLVVRYLGHRSG
jgi:sigma-B regulation protein RsbU (phosphoserine phosphatase)